MESNEYLGPTGYILFENDELYGYDIVSQTMQLVKPGVKIISMGRKSRIYVNSRLMFVDLDNSLWSAGVDKDGRIISYSTDLKVRDLNDLYLIDEEYRIYRYYINDINKIDLETTLISNRKLLSEQSRILSKSLYTSDENVYLYRGKSVNFQDVNANFLNSEKFKKLLGVYREAVKIRGQSGKIYEIGNRIYAHGANAGIINIESLLPIKNTLPTDHEIVKMFGFDSHDIMFVHS